MIIDILAVGLVLFALVNFLKGVEIALVNPLYLGVGIVSIILLYLLTLLPKTNLTKVEMLKGGLFWKIKSNNNLRISVALLLLVISLGNFIYATKWKGTPTANGIEYIEAVTLSLLAFLLLKKK